MKRDYVGYHANRFNSVFKNSFLAIILFIFICFSAFAGEITVSIKDHSGNKITGAYFELWDANGSYIGQRDNGNTFSNLVIGKSYIVFAGYAGTTSNELTFTAGHGQNFEYVAKKIIGTDKFHIYIVEENYFKPSHEFVNMSFGLEKKENVKFTIYDINGNLISEVKNSKLPKGTHTVQWDGTSNSGRPVGNGVYIVLLEAGKKRNLSRVMLNR